MYVLLLFIIYICAAARHLLFREYSKYTILDIQFRSVKFTLLLVYAKISSNISFLSKRHKAINVLLNVYICALKKRSAPLIPEDTIKCTDLATQQIYRTHQLK